MVKKTIRLTDEANEILEQIAQDSDIGLSQALEKILTEYNAQPTPQSSAESQQTAQPNADAIQKMLKEIYILKKIENENYKKLYLLTEVLNSFITNACICFPEGYTTEPHDWFDKATDDYNKMLNSKKE